MKNNKTTFNVIMPAFNAEKYIHQSIQSVLDQSYTNFELIVVNDGSTDKTEEIVKSFVDKRIRYFKQTNKGVSSARNLAIKHSNGEWLTFLDADDVWLPQTLEIFSNYFEQADFIFGEYTYFGGRNSDKTAKDLTTLLDNREYLMNELFKHNFIGIGAVCMRINLTKEYFDETMVFAEDYKLWLSLFTKDIRIKKINKVLYKYRIHPESALHKNNKQEYLMAKLLLSFADKNENAMSSASYYYNSYLNTALSELMNNNDYGVEFKDNKKFYLQSKTKLKLFLYMKHPKILKKIVKILNKGIK